MSGMTIQLETQPHQGLPAYQAIMHTSPYKVGTVQIFCTLLHFYL